MSEDDLFVNIRALSRLRKEASKILSLDAEELIMDAEKMQELLIKLFTLVFIYAEINNIDGEAIIRKNIKKIEDSFDISDYVKDVDMEDLEEED